jgi:hypothetical protein
MMLTLFPLSLLPSPAAGQRNKTPDDEHFTVELVESYIARLFNPADYCMDTLLDHLRTKIDSPTPISRVILRSALDFAAKEPKEVRRVILNKKNVRELYYNGEL